MKRLTIGEITRAVGGELLCGQESFSINSVSTDSRTVGSEELFFALIGEQFDAHDFLKQGIERGCRAFVISKKAYYEEMKAKDASVILVGDTTKGLQDLATYYLASCNIKKIGVTGSTGKTTTKEMLYHILSQKFKTICNKGNLNNHIGLPLTAFTVEADTEVGIFEMGMSEFGEIDRLVHIVKPDVGIITNIGASHIENLGSRNGILKAKLEITNCFQRKNVLIINEDENLLTKEKSRGDYVLLTVGENGRNDFILSGITDLGERGITFHIEHQKEMQTFTLKLPGRHNAYNAAVASACAVSLGMTLKEAAQGLSRMEVITDKRLNIKGKGGIKVIDDTYNASPDSMKAALDVLMSTSGIRKIAVLADMLEMGKESRKYHREVGEYAANSNVDLLLCVGEHAKDIAQGALGQMGKERVFHRKTKEEAYSMLDNITPGDVILVKGSRGMEMDKVVKKIMEKE